MGENRQTSPWRTLIVDDHPVVLNGTTQLFSACQDFVVVGTATSGQAALQLVHELNPALLILDIRLPDISGIEVARATRADFPGTHILILTGYDDPAYVKALTKVGIHSMLLKTTPGGDIITTARRICTGELLPIAEAPSGGSIDQITEREQVILSLLVAGQRNREIAEQLQISVKTVEYHVSQIFEKLSVRSRAEAVGKAITLGLVMRGDGE